MDSRQKVIESAKRLFWTHGYSTTSPKQVMADSGVGQGSFYHHFPAKSDLGRVVIEENGRDLLATVRSAMEGADNGRDRLIRFLGTTADALEGCRIGGFSYDAGILADPELRETLGSAFEAMTTMLEGVVREGQSDGSLSTALDPTSTAAAVFALVEGAFITARASGRQTPAHNATLGALLLLPAEPAPTAIDTNR
ncbi:TetR/AcrR family transcriptional regulator [Mycetocola saprophilus]|uniref:TetR/AcrR family transcriptional regulator n=1 Tax=Mycetocola saprophilus TaxID=76636 RepID=UPI003BEF5437